jgi:hypothetical protein
MAALVSWAGPRAPASASVFRDWFTLGLCGLALGTAVLCLPLACSFVRPQARPAIASLAPGRDRAPRRTGPRTVPRSGTAAAPLPAAETLAGDFQLAVPVLSRPEPSAARTQPRPAPPPVLAAETMPAEDFQLPIPVRPRREPLSALPPIKGDALLWKECNLPKTPFSPYWLSFFVLLGGSMLGLWLARSGPQGMPHLIFRSAVILLAGFVCFGVSMRAAGCIIRERHQKTLESLLLLPITAGELVARKWLGAVLYYRFYLVPLVFVLLLPVLVGVVHPIGAVLVFLAILIHVGFLVSLGMAVSAAAQKPIEAHFLLAILLVLVFAGPWWWLVLSEMQPSNRWFPVLEVGLNPVGSWNFLLFNWNDLRLDDEQVAHKLLIAAAGLCVYGAAGIGLFLATRLGFRT